MSKKSIKYQGHAARFVHPNGQMVKATFYVEVVKHLKDGVRRMRPNVGDGEGATIIRECLTPLFDHHARSPFLLMRGWHWDDGETIK